MQEDSDEWSYKESFYREESPESLTMRELTEMAATYHNVVAALLAGAPQVSRDGTVYELKNAIREGMSERDINVEAQVMASYVVG